MSQHKIKLSRGAYALCASMFTAPGVLKDPKHVWWAGLLLTAVFPQDKAPVLPKDRAATEEELDAQEKWAESEVPEKEITEGQRDTIKHVIVECIKQGGVPASKYTNELMSTFGLAPE